MAVVRAAFPKAAANAKRLGFDAVEVHGAHGYLSTSSSGRAQTLPTDRYCGATLKERGQFDGENGLNLAGWAKKLTGASTTAVGSVGLPQDSSSAFRGEGSTSVSPGPLIERMERDEFDLIAVGRALLSEPKWVSKTRP